MTTWFWARVAILVALAVAVLVTPSDASAQGFPLSVPLSELIPLEHPALTAAQSAADAEWQRPATCTPRYAHYPDVVPAAGVIVERCLIIFNTRWIMPLLDRDDPAAKRLICAALTHERGHIHGYADFDPGPLSGIMTSAVWELALPSCLSYAGTPAAPEPAVERPMPQKGLHGDLSYGDAPCGHQCRARAQDFTRRIDRKSVV